MIVIFRYSLRTISEEKIAPLPDRACTNNTMKQRGIEVDETTKTSRAIERMMVRKETVGDEELFFG